jgi:hypothetical protein
VNAAEKARYRIVFDLLGACLLDPIVLTDWLAD